MTEGRTASANIESLQEAFAQEQRQRDRAAAVLLTLETLDPSSGHGQLSYHDQVRRLREVLTRELTQRDPSAAVPAPEETSDGA